MNPVHLAPIDKLLILIYLAAILIIGLRSSRQQRDNPENFLLAGRKLSLPAFTATLVSTWYGGILGIGEFTYRYGLLNWVTQALPYYLFAILFAVFVAPKIRRTNLFTIPDQLYNNFGRTAGLIGSILIFLLVSPASYLLMISIILSSIFSIQLWIGVLVGIIFSTVYVFFGGFNSVVKTDIVQFILMFIGFAILVVTLVSRFGGITFLRENLPRAHLQLSGGQNFQYIFVWFFIALWTFVDPGFYQRCYAAKTPKTARNGIIISVGFWITFDFFTTTAGLYARAIFKDIPGLMAFPLLGEQILPPILSGLFFIALLATIMSTLDSNSFLAAVSFGRDIVWRIRKNTDVTIATQVGLGLTLVFSVILLSLVPSVVKIWYFMGSLIIPSLLLPLVSVFFQKLKASKHATVTSMISTFGGTAIWLIIGITRGNLTTPEYPFNIQPFFLGLFISLIIYTPNILKTFFRR